MIVYEIEFAIAGLEANVGYGSDIGVFHGGEDALGGGTVIADGCAL